MAWQDLYGSRYLNASDLEGGNIVTKILKWEVQQVGRGKNESTKIVLTLEGQTKGLALNTTNCETLVELFGPDEDKWIDEEVELFPAKVMFEGKLQKGVRIRKPETSRKGRK